MKPYKAILVGNGTMGKRHRMRFEACGVQFAAVVDNLDEFNGISDKLNSGTAGGLPVDFVVIASPAVTHYAYAKFFVERRIPVFVEKPLATTAGEAQELVDLAVENGTLLFVAQSECYNPLFLNFRKHFMSELSQGRNSVQLEFRREHRYSPRCRDVDVRLDLLVHDLSLFFTLFKYKDVEASGSALGNADASRMRLEVVRGPYKGVAAEFYVNRDSDVDVRTISVSYGRQGDFPGSSYTVSLARYDNNGEIAHIPDSLDNEHRFFLKLLAGACGEWGRRAAQSAADCVKFATHQ